MIRCLLFPYPKNKDERAFCFSRALSGVAYAIYLTTVLVP